MRLERQPNCPSGLHHPVTVCRKARCLDKPSLGDFFPQETIHKPNVSTAQLPLGITYYDGLKVAMPGDRLVNGGASLPETNAASQQSATRCRHGRLKSRKTFVGAVDPTMT